MQLIENASKEKLRGGFYTPSGIAAFMLRWAFNGRDDFDILEPSCGDGVFLEELKSAGYKFSRIKGIELDKEEAKKSRKVGLESCQILESDFHQYCVETSERFDLVVGNPPYIRYQYFDKKQQEYASEIFRRAGLKYSKLTNAWVSFVVGSSLLLKEKGKIAFVLPAELLQVSYAQPLREYLATFYNKINIVSFERLVFPDIQQEVVLLLCEKNGTNEHLIEHVEVHDACELDMLDMFRLKRPQKQIDFHSNKWTFYFLSQEEIDLIERIQRDGRIKKFGEFATVEVGITTGSNPFFTVPLSTVQEFNLEKYAKPLVGRSVQVPSAIFTLQDWNKNRENEARTHLLTFPKMEQLNGSIGARRYISDGVRQKINEGYKCRIREEWQIVPSLRVSEALFIRRNNIYPKLIINDAKAYTTDTMHRVNVKQGVNLQALTASYYNSLSLAFTEICGRSHGGGVLELMPNEVENVLIPYDVTNKKLLNQIDRMIRSETDVSKILELTDRRILIELFGFKEEEVVIIKGIWKKLSKRRLNRK